MERNFVSKLIEEKAAHGAGMIAVEEGGTTLTYQQLNAQCNQLSALLSEAGVGRDVIVAVLLPAGIPLVQSMIAVMKSGGIYLPMDIEFSRKRFRQIVESTFHGILITSREFYEFSCALIKELSVDMKCMIVYEDNSSFTMYGPSGDYIKEVDLEKKEYPVTDPVTEILPDQSSYIFYTSGSTGEGKSILGCHKSLAHYILWTIKEFSVTSAFRGAFLSQVTFDTSLMDTLMPLCAGATLCIPPRGIKENMVKLIGWIQTSRVTAFQTVPSMFRVLMKNLTKEAHTSSLFPDLKYVMLCGEVLYAKDIRTWRSLAGEATEIVNLYGTTETTILDTFHRIREIPENPSEIIHAGHPMDNTFIAIINDGHLCRIGEIGEIYIKTPFLTKGYYGNKKLTDEVFVQNPLISDREDIIYKTGDKGRYLNDRSIEVLGRIDRQVKVNGIRIELGEIEQPVLYMEGVNQVVVKVHKGQDDNSALICYYTADSDISPEDLKVYLKGVLNRNIIPHYFIKLNEFPLNLNGKVDKNALPLPEISNPDALKLPENEVEAKLKEIWQEVLNIHVAGTDVSFLKAGGHSLKAIQLISRIYKELNVDLNIGDIFEYLTIQEQAAYIRSLQEAPARTIPRIDAAPDYALSYGQKRLWILSQFEGSNLAYHINSNYALKGALDLPAFESAFEALVDRHEILRTTFVVVDEEPRQRVHSLKETGYKLGYRNLQGLEDQQTAVDEILHTMSKTPFDLEKGPLLRALILHLSPESYVFSFTMHHIISDGWSMEVLVREVLSLYESCKNGTACSLPPLQIQYRDYAAWQGGLSKDKMEAHRQYWLQQLQRELPVLDLPADHPRPMVKTYRGSTVNFNLHKETGRRLKEISGQKDATLFMTLLSSIHVLLYKYTGQQDLIIGSPIAGRDSKELEDQVGFYVNTLALRTTVDPAGSFEKLLEQVKRTTIDAYRHQQYPFDRLVEELNLKRDMSRSPLFDVMVVLQAPRQESTLALNDLTVSGYDSINDVSKFDLTIYFQEIGEGISVMVEYNTDLLGKAFVERLIRHYNYLLEQLTADTCAPLRAVSLLDKQEEDALKNLNNTRRPYERGKCIHELFELKAAEAPESTAVVYEDRTLSYRKLNEKANQLAHYLRATYSIRREDRIGVMMDRTEHMLIAILGILKSGAAYVPIDPSYPAGRIRYMFSDSGVKAILTDSNEYLFGEKTLVLQELSGRLKNYPTSNLEKINKADDLAYVIYTSGSTGIPKGVMIEHSNTLAFLEWCKEEFDPSLFDIVYASTSYCFDLSVFEMFYPLSIGKKLRIIKNGFASRNYFGQDDNVLLNTVPSVVEALLQEGADFSKVKVLNMAGEPVSYFIKESLDCAKIEMRNLYGPSEDTTYSTCYKFDKNDALIYIGRPISNTEIWIMDEALRSVPAGIKGEICISGDGLARGYLNNEMLTREKFVPHPYQLNQVLYRTGDIGRLVPGGNIEFLGRKDHQVKIRGYRIEPGEIEHAIESMDGVAKALVMVRENQNREKYLVTYYTALKGAPDLNLKEHLIRKLPHYMIPASFLRIESFPLTSNGKIDRQALPDPVQDSSNERVMPRDGSEAKLAKIWQDVLGRTEIGIRDNFFDLGGHSLKAMQVLSRANKAFNVRITIQDAFTYATIEEQAQFINRLSSETYEALVPSERNLHEDLQTIFVSPADNQYVPDLITGHPDDSGEEIII